MSSGASVAAAAAAGEVFGGEQSGLSGAQKHRACDECRSRKLACSKEAEGCARCRREGIPCHYSLQKQMGRPRKRPREDTDDLPALADSANKTPMISIPPDTEDPGLAFLSFLSGGDNIFDASLPMDMPFPADSTSPEAAASWHVDPFGQVDFSPPAAEHMPSFSPADMDPALFSESGSTDVATTPASVPYLSPGSSASPGSSGSSMASSAECAIPNCSCTAALYMSIDSLQRLSEDITEAIRQARLAAKTAYRVVNCPICSVPPSLGPAEMGKTTQRALHAFQNLMLLATLIPSCVAAYERILQAVDGETARAQAEGRQIPFKLLGYGGTWGALGSSGRCSASHLEYKVMEPAMWRLTIRALLRVDVYGIAGRETTDAGFPDGAHDGPFHLGLKDIVLQMENRSKVRHAMVDGLTAAGLLKEPDCVLKMHKPGETPTCLRIISMARQSIDNLVIA